MSNEPNQYRREALLATARFYMLLETKEFAVTKRPQSIISSTISLSFHMVIAGLKINKWREEDYGSIIHHHNKDQI